MGNKILYIASADIYKKSGGGYANLAFYKSLLNHYGERLDLVPFVNTMPDGIDPDFFVTPKTLKQKLFDFPRGIIHRYNKWIYTFLEKRKNEYCCCIINDGLKGDIIPLIKQYIPKVIVIHHNCEVDFQNDNNRPTTLFGLFPFFVKRNERMSYNLADLNLFLTRYDQLKFKRKYGAIDVNKSKVIGAYFPLNETINIPPNLDSNIFSISGGLNNIQTIKGIKSFEKYFPIMQNILGNSFKIIVTGRNPGKYIRKFSQRYPQIELIPNPEDLTDVIKCTGVFICPVNVGSGIKLRVLDGLKLGMPVLIHEVSARGYECFFDEPWFKVYHDEVTFKLGLLQLRNFCLNTQNIRSIIIEAYKKFFSFDAGDYRFIGLVDFFCRVQ